MHIFSLNPKKHADFLKQERKDPITGDAFKAGDEVVFCAACRSAFLRESWEFMEGKHCNQVGTLALFPKPDKELAIANKQAEQYYPKPWTKRQKIRIRTVLLCTIAPIVGFVSSSLAESSVLSDYNTILLLPLYILGLLRLPFLLYTITLFVILVTTRKDDEIPPFFRGVRLSSRFIRYRSLGIPQTVKLSSLKLLHVSQENIGGIYSRKYYFTFSLYSSEKKEFKVKIKGEEVCDMLEALVLLSKCTAVTVSVCYQRQYDFLTAKKEEYQAPIEIEVLD